MKAPLIIALLFSLGGVRAEPMGGEELVRRLSAGSDLSDWATQNGIDLPKLVGNCIDESDSNRQADAWMILVTFLHRCGADGAAGEELSSVGPSIAANTDRERLAEITESIPEEQWESLPYDPVVSFGYTELDEREKAAIGRKYPILVRIIEDTLLRSRDYPAWKAAKEKREAARGGGGER